MEVAAWGIEVLNKRFALRTKCNKEKRKKQELKLIKKYAIEYEAIAASHNTLEPLKGKPFDLTSMSIKVGSSFN